MLIHLWLATWCTLHGRTDSRVCPVVAVLVYIAVKPQVPGLQFVHRNECQLYGLTFPNSSHWHWLNLAHFTRHSFWIKAASSAGQDWSLGVSNPNPRLIVIICISTVDPNANSNTPRCVLGAGLLFYVLHGVFPLTMVSLSSTGEGDTVLFGPGGRQVIQSTSGYKDQDILLLKFWVNSH